MALSTTHLPPIDPDPAKVKPADINTLVDPFDLVDPDSGPWFPPGAPAAGARQPNEVIAYIQGRDAFRDMYEAIKTIDGPGHFLYLAGWQLQHTVQLVPGDPASGFDQQIRRINAAGAQVRALLYHQLDLSDTHNDGAVAFLADPALFNVAVIHDDRVVEGNIIQGIVAPYVGVHHQKMLVVSGREGLIGFQGGMDIAFDRLDFRGNGQGLHDAHTRLRGPSARALHKIFVDRWNDHPVNQGAHLPVDPPGDPAPITPDLQVHVGRTVPNTTELPLHPRPSIRPAYRFAPNGDQTAKQIVLQGIASARRFIYIEDQYLFDMSLSQALAAALSRIRKLVILITDADQVPDQLQPWERRRDFLLNLTDGAEGPTEQVAVCALDPARRYVHSKTFIFDDKLAVIGSANLTRRGYSHDSEQNAGIFDPNTGKRFDPDRGRRLCFAHELRMHLWAKHFNLRPLDMLDPIAAAVHFWNPIGDVRRYLPSAKTDPFPTRGKLPVTQLTKDLVWNLGIDPDGSR